MNARAIVVILLALACGFGAVVGLQKLRGPSGDQKTATTEETPSKVVVVAVDKIPGNRLIDAKDLKLVDYPKGKEPAGSMAKIEDAAGRITKAPFFKDAPIQEAGLAPKGSRPSLENLIPSGMRAVSVPANAAGAGIGFILPGSKVDVLVTTRDNSAVADTGGGISKTLLEAVEVIAVNDDPQYAADGKTDAKSVVSATLLVTPKQVLELEQAKSLGTLSLSLRSPNDTEGVLSGVVTGRDIKGAIEKPSTEPAEKPGDSAMAGPRDVAEKTPPKPDPTLAKEKSTPKAIAKDSDKAYDLKVSEIVTFRGNSRGQLTVIASSPENK